jgi:hypothetical protein
MKKLFILFSFILVLSADAQFTSTSMTVVDPSGQVWANGYVTYAFSPAPGFQGPYQWQGANLPNQYLTPQIANLDGTGSATIALPDNSTITPSNSAWNFVICSNTSFQCISIRIPVGGSSDNISAIVNGIIPAISLPATTFPRAYLNGEITLNPTLGGLYYDTTLSCLKVWNGTSWACLSTSLPLTIQVNGTLTANQGLVNFESSNNTLVASNPAGGIINYVLNPSLLGTFCLTNGTNCGHITVNGQVCDIAGSCTIPTGGTTTINGVGCVLNGSCTVPSTGTTTINTIPCPLNGSCTVPVDGTARTCNANGCFKIEADGTVFEWGSVTVTPSTTAQGTATINFPYVFPTQFSLSLMGQTVSGCVTGDALVPLGTGISAQTLSGASVNVSKFAVAGGGGANFNSSPACIVQWSAIGY